jgi:glycosyltransferase involved in cell wall biosynthesis
MYGARLPGRKLCYVQGVNTYQVLDAFFDEYIFSAEFVRQHAKKYFGVDGVVINPFIDVELFRGGQPWEARHNSVAVLGFKPIVKQLLPMVLNELSGTCPAIPVNAYEYISQKELADQLGQTRYYLSLSPLEGFGLPMMEAMGSGCAVIGFTAFGGREFICHNYNALVTDYPKTKEVAEYLSYAILNSEHAKTFAKNAFQTSRKYGKKQFDERWHIVLEKFLNNT